MTATCRDVKPLRGHHPTPACWACVHDPERGASDLVILAAQDFTGRPVARVHLPAPVPLGVHGSWVPDGWR